MNGGNLIICDCWNVATLPILCNKFHFCFEAFVSFKQLNTFNTIYDCFAINGIFLLFQTKPNYLK